VTDRQKAILDYINKKWYGQAVGWIMSGIGVENTEYAQVKSDCELLVREGLILKHANGRYAPKGGK
jgi:hypothetical protein